MISRIISVILAAALSLSFSVEFRASGAYIPPDSIQYQYFYSCSSKLSISGTTATCNSSVNGIPGTTTKIEIVQTLQKRTSSNSWSNVASWSGTYNSVNASMTKYKYNLTSGTYRIKSEFAVYSGSSHESTTKYSAEKTI